MIRAMGLFRSSPDRRRGDGTCDPARRGEPREADRGPASTASDEASAWRITVDSTVESHSFSYGAVWLPDGPARCAIGYETGPIAPRDARRSCRPTGAADAGLVGRAYRTEAVATSGSMNECGDCQRCQAAARAGMAAAIVMPVITRNEERRGVRVLRGRPALHRRPAPREVGVHRPDRRAGPRQPPRRRRTAPGRRRPAGGDQRGHRARRRAADSAPRCASRWTRSAPRSAGRTARTGQVDDAG